MRLKLSGYAWTRGELAAFGHRTYTLTKARMERCYVRVRRPSPMFAKIDAIDGDAINDVPPEAPAPLLPVAPASSFSAAATARRLLLLQAQQPQQPQQPPPPPPRVPTTVTVLDEAQLKRCLRTVHYYKRRRQPPPMADAEELPPLHATSFVDAWLTDAEARTFDEVVFDPSRPPGPFETGDAAGGGAWSWNNWPGILGATLPPHDNAGALAGVQRIRDHITEVRRLAAASVGLWWLASACGG